MISTYPVGKGGPAEKPRCEDGVVMVVGAAGGIGSAVSIQLAEEGATVLLLDKNQRGLDSLYDEIVARNCPEPVQIREDLASLDEARATVIADQLEANFPRLDALIFVAQENAPLAPIEHYPVDAFGRLLNAQVVAPWILIRTLLPHLRKSEAPRIVFSSGAAGRQPAAYYGPVALCWSSTDTLAGVMAQEFDQNEKIRVFSIDPGVVNTSLQVRWYPGRVPTKYPPPEAVADAYVFLACRDSADFRGPECTFRDGVLEASDAAR